MDLKGKRVILSSASPRRCELLAGLDVKFEVDARNGFTESIDPDTPHEKVPEIMSVGKSRAFWRPLEKGEILITADTMVLLDKFIMGKPHSRYEAVDMLQKLSGRTHEVISAVTFRDYAHEQTVTDTTFVSFREITQEEIDYYVDTCRPYDKAGAYGIQEWIGYAACTGIKGSFYNVMGFPVHKVYEELLKFIGYE
ncbi:MAG TPA: Maf family nucleotide pyrophosphatase [Candidatus Cryptobacteroides sp.]|nr:Maf family nucleotide pyrophosphatase [Candidatus Cryptobacteroides sp.]